MYRQCIGFPLGCSAVRSGHAVGLSVDLCVRLNVLLVRVSNCVSASNVECERWFVGMHLDLTALLLRWIGFHCRMALVGLD